MTRHQAPRRPQIDTESTNGIAPDSTDPEELRRVCETVAVRAAAHVRRRRPEVFGALAASGHANPVQAKSTRTDPVTVVDTESESLVRDLLARLRPGEPILGEEEGGAGAAPDGVRWVVDPIDGTVNFLYGIPAYAVSVAAQIGGASVAGAVVDVPGEQVFSASLAGGATLTDQRSGVTVALRCTDVSEMAMALTATGFGYGAGRRREQGRIIAELLPLVRDLRRVGSAAIDLCMVACGRVDAHFEHGLSPWDWAAGGLIAAEAGAVVLLPDADSRSDDGQVTLACAPGVADEFVSVLREIGGLRALPQ